MNELITLFLPPNTLIPDIINIIGSYVPFSLYDLHDLIHLSTICRDVYKYILNNFDELFEQIKHTEETFMLFNLKKKNILLTVYSDLIFFLGKSHLTGKEMLKLNKFLRRANLNFPIFKSLLWTKFHSNKCSNLKNKIIQKILNSWTSLSEKYCEHNISPCIISDTNRNKKKIINTYLVVTIL